MRIALVLLLVWLPGVFKNTPPVTREHAYGSGVVVKNGLVLTASHVLGPDMKVWDKPAEVVAINKEYDLMLLKADVKGKARFAKPILDEVAVVIGYGFAIKMVTRGRVISIEEKGCHMFLDAVTPQGMSGAAVYNKHGQVIGLMAMVRFDDVHNVVGLAVTSQILKPFVEGKGDYREPLSENPEGQATSGLQETPGMYWLRPSQEKRVRFGGHR